ncbi:hypothetical protein [uncultured Clostridium sp.]|uniref:hypothetical protein n=1 Tax=uncultured Clostridium sp. TaxID=59620 RepID=UPI002625EDB5|nr:hypothetical protein [uncultured Clostridium sp.]
MKKSNKKNINLFNTLSNHSKKLTIGSILASSIVLVNFYPAITAHATTVNTASTTKITQPKYNISIKNTITPVDTQSATLYLEPEYTISSSLTGIPSFNTDYSTYNLTYIFGGIALLNNKNTTNINTNNYYVSINNLNTYNLDMSDGSSAQSSSLTQSLNEMSLNIVNSALSNNYTNPNYTIYSGSELLKMAQSGQALPKINGIIHQNSLTTKILDTTGWAGDSMMGPQLSNVIVGISNSNSSNYFSEHFNSLTNSNSDTLFTNNNGGYDFVLGSYGYLDGMSLGNWQSYGFQSFTQSRNSVTDSGSILSPGTYFSASPSTTSLGQPFITSRNYKDGLYVGTSLGSFLELDGLNNNYLTLNVSGIKINPTTSTVTLNYVTTNNETVSKTLPLSSFINLGNGNYAYKLSNIANFAHFTSNNSEQADFTAHLYFADAINFDGSTPTINVNANISSTPNGSSTVNGILSANNTTSNFTINTNPNGISFSCF